MMKIPDNWKYRWAAWRRRWRRFRKDARLYFHYLQDDIYEIDQVAHPYLRIFTALLSLMVIASVLLPIGFELTPRLVQINQQIEGWILFGFVLSFLTRFSLTSKRTEYLKKRWFEGILSVVSMVILVDYFIYSIGIVDLLFADAGRPGEMFLQFLKGYLLFLVFIKFVQYLPELLDKQKNTARFLVYSFLSLIAGGTFLLMLPGATIDGEGLVFIDALFTSTSAVCVTGLIVVDTATHFTLFGELVILALIQLGGIGIITFATFLFLFISGGLGVGQMNTLKSLVGEANTNLVTSTLKKVVGFTFMVEAAGAVCYYLFWEIEFESVGQRLLFSVFHAVSAFCNAGFSLFTGSLSHELNVTNTGINITTMVLIVLGGLGFTVIWELIHRRTKRSPWRRRLSLHSRTVLVTTAVLIVAGAALFALMEWNRTLAPLGWGDKVMASFFQSITTRTAGFNTVDTGAVGMSAALVTMMLMFIGGSPASTAGGIKTTTFAVLMRSIWTTIRGYNRMELYNRTVPNTVVFRAMTMILLAASCIGISTILLSLVEQQPLLDLLFEEISAFATVGLSRGITAELSSRGKMIIIVSMFLGRVGILTFMVAFASSIDSHKYKYPEETLMVS